MISVLVSPFFLLIITWLLKPWKSFLPLCLLLHPVCVWDHTSLPTQGSGSPPKIPKHPVTFPFFFSGNGNILKRLSCPFLCRSGFGNNRLSEISFLRNLLLRTDRAQPGGIQRRNCLQRSIYILWHDLSGETWSWGRGGQRSLLLDCI